MTKCCFISKCFFTYYFITYCVIFFTFNKVSCFAINNVVTCCVLKWFYWLHSLGWFMSEEVNQKIFWFGLGLWNFDTILFRIGLEFKVFDTKSKLTRYEYNLMTQIARSKYNASDIFCLDQWWANVPIIFLNIYRGL